MVLASMNRIRIVCTHMNTVTCNNSKPISTAQIEEGCDLKSFSIFEGNFNPAFWDFEG